MQWFRLYGDIIDDTKIRLLAFEDRWHYVAVCAMKCNGLLDKPDDDLRLRMMAVALGVQTRELEEIKRRLLEVKLIDDSWHPVGWDKRQYKQPDLPDGESLEGYKGYVYFISDARMETVKIGYSKNPWARVKDLQTGRTAKMKVVATVKTTDTSEADVHRLFDEERKSGEWFVVSPRIQSLIDAIKAKQVRDVADLVNYVATTVVTTKEAETETETEITPKGVCASGDAPANDNFSIDDFVESWNATADQCGLSKIRKLTDARKRAFKVRQREYPDIADWQSAFRCLRENKWMHGDNRNGWRADPDFFLQAKSFTKLVEGSYAQADR